MFLGINLAKVHDYVVRARRLWGSLDIRDIPEMECYLLQLTGTGPRDLMTFTYTPL